MVLVALCSYSVSGVRGTDQYWYIADTETLMRNDPPLTNFRFPGMVLRENSSDPITYFVHNGPLLHLNSYLANFLNTSAINAWEKSNLVWWIGSAFFLFFVLRNIVALHVAALGAMMYLMTPIVVWQAANFLQEMWLGFLTAVFFFYSYILKENNWHHWLLAVFVFIGGLSHPFFVLSSAYLIVAAVLYRKHYMFIVTLCAALLFAIFFKDSMFPSSFPPDLHSIVTSTIPGKTNLHWQFDNHTIPITAELIGSKLSEAVNKQFFSAASMPLTIVTNIGLFSLLTLIFLRRFRLNRVLCFALFCVGAWMAMVILLQNQSRYQLLILPPLVACILLLLQELVQPKAMVKLLVLCTSCFFAADIYLLSRIRSDIHNESQLRLSVTSALAGLPSDARYAVVDEDRSLTKLVISQLSPAVGLMVDPRYIQENNLVKVVELFKPEFVISTLAELPDVFANNLEARNLENIDDKGQITVYRLRDN